MRLFLTVTLIIASALLTLAVAACGDDDEENGGTTAATTAAAGGDETAVEVEAADFSFDPTTFTVPAATDVTITLNNTGAVAHTLTVYKDEEFTDSVSGADTDNVSAGSAGEFTASFEAGEYYFRCENHPTLMQGEFEAE